ncbi:Schizosaccharomyces specific protein [Schizosaccharomyces osmophilus]|uniref:Schizosaccharomyces specific protein n=1 Tax=Schizosaccharomyces osmophilus TaxID=2545709 RepID=A0AAE9WEA2_9SCHI|nr:Schizosaccharomyces specific protein [Schizosaccharomyces osmophilus]WBW74655.1 Schizosaccharomyces specific protein [Schizosaccharomyces osmophilus]
MQVRSPKHISPVATVDLKKKPPALPTFWIAFPATRPIGFIRPRINRRITQVKQRAETEEAIFNLYQRWNPFSFSYRLILTDAIRDDKKILAWFFTKRFGSPKVIMKHTTSHDDGYMNWAIKFAEKSVIFDDMTSKEPRQVVWKLQNQKAKHENTWKADLVLPSRKQRMSVGSLNGFEIKFHAQVFEYTTRLMKFRHLEVAIFSMALYVKIYDLKLLHACLLP